MAADDRSEKTVLLLAAAILANGAAGLLYIWSLFILPMEAALGLNRADLGLISSLALISFTVGVSVLPAIVARVGRMSAAGLAFALIAGGHLAFSMSASWAMLALGYGVGFGAGSGMAYGLALSLAASMPAQVRAKAIGLAMGAFALSGIVLPVALGTWIATTAPDAAFWRIGIVVLVVGALCLASLAGAAANTKDGAAAMAATGPIAVDRPFLVLSLIFFLICFIGLATISQAAAMAAAAGIASPGFAATALTLGYLVGSLLGAPLAERAGERMILVALGSFSLAGALAMLAGSQPVLLLGAALIGVTFGGSGSIMPVLLGMRYGAANISRLYGRMIIAYGLAGLTAPGLAGLLYQSAQSYTLQLALCAAMAVLVLVAVLILERKAKPG